MKIEKIMTERELNYKFIVNRIVKTAQDKLTDWELEFISSVYEWYILKDKIISQKQKDIIIKINRRIMGRL